MKYQLVTADSQEALTQRVNILLKDGWELQGSVSVSQTSKVKERNDFQFFSDSRDTYYMLYAQAMVKAESK